ncbi:DNA-binding XRE family transcriptional regulator [Anseongella ginsenosidimutans]|uniref:DNA-binding XRE family transcriptional regulator n=1 Tax=Anseongella ginsenosidimutans TaxID=496056 RepID=A0A4R3KWY1_9SPHI|nr:helix-turn-helix transcriptional regulator [Anseongella ginsenosidimutans]QEC51653.1 helix-turn-helix transcriptional regulator [Anseongella ginsenosidimutans]TCS88990.1 DNA-binding XRE family transcriptional regulator [Anseongella ginsenosidimutans]
MNGKKPVFNRIKAVLAEKGKTNLWLAQKLGMNKTTVSKWCTNSMQPTVETLFEVARALNADVRELLVPSKNKGSDQTL